MQEALDLTVFPQQESSRSLLDLRAHSGVLHGTYCLPPVYEYIIHFIVWGGKKVWGLWGSDVGSRWAIAV
jgi:hypothetical protein